MERQRNPGGIPPQNLTLHAFYSRTPNTEVLVASVPKGACTSIKSSFGHKNTVRADVALGHKRDGGRILFFVREPIARLNSAYYHFTRAGEPRFPWCVDPKDPEYIVKPDWPCIEDMIDAMLDDNFLDRHWAPQTDNLTFEGEFMPTEVHQWGDLTRVLADETSTALGFHNKSTSRKAPITHRLDELHEYYARDYELLET